MDLIDKPSTQGKDATRAGAASDDHGAEARLDGVAKELAQAVSRGDVSREQADAFLRRLLSQTTGSRPVEF